MPQLNFEDLTDLLVSLEHDVWLSVWREWKEDAKYYDGEQQITVPVWIQDNDHKVVPPSGREKIDHAVDQVVSFEPTVTRWALGDSANAKKRAEKLGKWGTFLLQGFNDEAALPPYKTFAKHMFLYGYANKYGPLWDDNVWPLRPSKRKKDFHSLEAKRKEELKNVFPFRMIVPHPSKILLDPTELKKPTFGFYRDKRFFQQLKNEFGDALESNLNFKPYDRVEVTAYWSADQHVLMGQYGAGDSGIIFQNPKGNPYGFVPFTQAFLGLGRDIGYDSGGGDAMAKMAVGFLRAIRSQMRAETLQATAVNHLLYRMAFQHVLTTMDETEFAEKYGNNIVIGSIGGEDISRIVRWEDVPNVPAWVFEFVRQTKMDIEKSTFGEVLQGVRPTGVDTGIQQAQITAKAKQVFVNPIHQINQVASIDVGRTAQLVDVFQDPVTMMGHVKGVRSEETVKPDDFQGNYYFQVDIEASDPVEQAAKMQTGLALLSAGIIDNKTMVEKYLPDIQDREQVEERVQIQQMIAPLLQSDIITQQVMAEFQRRMAEQGTNGRVSPPVGPAPPPEPALGGPPGLPLEGPPGMPPEAPPGPPLGPAPLQEGPI